MLICKEQKTYLGAEQNIVCALHTQHQTVVLVANLISVAAKPASAPNLVLLQPWKSVYKDTFTTYTWGWITMLQAPASN